MEEILRQIRHFRDERDWMQFHDAKNLSMSIAIEAAELMELFQWKTAEEATDYAARNRERVSEEVADVAIYLFEFADSLGIDVTKAIKDKLYKNALKYPVEKAKGVSTKYTDFK